MDFYDLDHIGVHVFVNMNPHTGKFTLNIYRKKTKEESEGETDWKLVHEQYLHSFYTRREAESEGKKRGFEIATRVGFIEIKSVAEYLEENKE